MIHHITATDTNLYLGVERSASVLTGPYKCQGIIHLKSTIGSSTYNGFSTRPEGDNNRNPLWQPFIIDETNELRFLASTSAELYLTVLEW